MLAAPTRPVSRYHGGKWRLASWVISHFPEHRIYVEPYGGAGSVLIRKPRAFAEIYNDLDREMVGLFRVLRDPVAAAALFRLIELTPWARDEFDLAHEPAADPVEQARRTLTRNSFSFGSANSGSSRSGFKATVHGARKNEATNWRDLPAHLAAVVDRLRGVVLENREAVEIMRQHDRADTLFYCDPPYPLSTRTGMRWPSDAGRAYRHDLLDDDHRGMASTLRSLKGMVILSGYPCDLYDRELFADWRRVEKRALADGARERVEVLWINPAAAAALGL